MAGLVVAIVGLTNSGKTVVAKFLEEKGFTRIRFGDVTEEHLQDEGLENTEATNQMMRMKLRKLHGMEAFAKLNLPRIEEALKKSPVAADGLYSWSEYKYLKEQLPEMATVAIFAPPNVRYERAKTRIKRSTKDFFKKHSVQDRDYFEIENMEKAGPIAMADYTILNHVQGMEHLKAELDKFWKWLNNGFKTNLG